MLHDEFTCRLQTNYKVVALPQHARSKTEGIWHGIEVRRRDFMLLDASEQLSSRALKPAALRHLSLGGQAMSDPLEEQESSTSRLKIILITIAVLAVAALAIWQGLELALRLTS